MIRLGAVVLAAVLVAGPALAAPKAGPSDPRIRVVDYDPWAVVKIEGVFRTATQILFADDETILHVAVGDATGWDVAAEGSSLFIKPKAAHGPTNLIVTTRRPAGERHYTFALTVRKSGEALFGLRFRYPADEAAAAKTAVSATAAALERRLVDLKLDRAVVEGPRNLDYTVQGAADLQPSEVSDNGRFTVLRFPANQPLPALYEVSADGTESLVPFDVRGEFVVVHAVVRQLRLRRGRQVLCIYNEAFEPYGTNPATGTAASDVERTDRGGPR